MAPDAARRRVPAVVPSVVAFALGGGLALFVSSRAFLTVHVARPRPLPELDVAVSGRTLQPAIAGLAVVLLAAVVAVPAVRGRARQLLGGVLVLLAVGLAWLCGTGMLAVGPDRARSLVLSARTGTTLDAAASVQVHTHPWWPLLGILGALVAAAGAVLTTVHGRSWRGLGARYDAPAPDAAPPRAVRSARSSDGAPTVPVPGGPDGGSHDAASTVAEGNDNLAAGNGSTAEAREAERARRDLALWHSLDRGEDPTATSASAGQPVSGRAAAGTEIIGDTDGPGSGAR